MARVAILLADGFETIEALAPCDALRRVKEDVSLVTLNETAQVESSHGIGVVCDATLADYDFDSCDMIVLPGGLPGTTNLRASERVCELTREFAANKKVAAICAAPSILGDLGLLEGKVATCFPGWEEEHFPAGVRPAQNGVYVDGNIITASAAGYAVPFAIEIVRMLCGDSQAEYVANGMQYNM